MSTDLRTIARFSDPIEAELACSRLLEEGLNAITVGDMASGLFGMNFTTGAIEIMVPADDRERAIEVLKDFASEIEALKHRPPEAITAEPPLPELVEEPKTPEELESEPNHGEFLTERAFRASLFGFILCTPLLPVAHIYAILLLLFVSTSGESLRGGYSIKYYVSFLLSALSVTGGTIAALGYGVGAFGLLILIEIGIAMFLFAVLSPWKRR